MKLKIKYEQLRRGFNFIFSLTGGKLTSVNFYATTRCNGKCQICNIWKKKVKEDISIKAVKNILKFENPGTQYFLSGGEFILHPQYQEILKLFKNKNYILLSNGLFSEKLLTTVKKFKIKRVVLSFDGIGKTYQRVRDVDKFEELHQLIHKLKKICEVSLNYTINPLNSSENDIFKADTFAKEHNVYLALGIYGQPEFFDTKLPLVKIPNKVPERSYPLNRYLSLYNLWQKGKYKIPCFGIRNSCTILANGDVSLCYGRNIIVGNLNRDNLKKIWESKVTRELQQQNLNCHKCWLICQKPMDIVIWDFLNKLKFNFLLKSDAKV